jgi:putative ABC transport system permease protein
MSLVLLLILTLSLGAYSASAAHTIDQNYIERVLYETPADLELWEAWEYDESTNQYFAPPFSEHFVDGVVEATPFRSFQATPQIGGSEGGHSRAQP